jgi:Ca2+-transporting ATPase
VQPVDHLLAQLATDPHAGLTKGEAHVRLSHDGPNSFGKVKRTPALRLLMNQFASSVVLLLLVAAAISAILKEFLQTAGIIVAVFINAGIGFITEYQARVSLEKLAALTEPTVRVRRDGHEHSIPTAELVAGDIVLLENGDRVPADLRVVSKGAVCVDESILTGESLSVNKTAESTEDVLDSILFQGTTISSGRAKAVVVATGTRTRLGQLSVTLTQLDATTTPLEEQLDLLGHKLTLMTVVLCVVFALAGVVQGLQPLMMLETAIALAVAAIPEGLPVVATLSLALGIQQMIKRRALVRRLPAVEALGCASVICTDKTGTLTQNKMLVTDLVSCYRRFHFTGEGYEPIGGIEDVENPDAPPDRVLLQQLMLPAVLCNDARLENHGGGWHIHGDPTEGALLVAGAKVELDQPSLLKTHRRVAELAFDLARKRMSTVNQTLDGSLAVYCKGSPESVVAVCTNVLDGKKTVPLQLKHKDWLELQNKQLAERGLRVLGLAYKKVEQIPACIDESSLESGLTFIGLIAMHDPAKPEVDEALRECRDAGIQVIMLTGDQQRTAFAVGKQLGICSSEGQLLSGDQVESLTPEELSTRLTTTTVFARVTPEIKLMLVRALQQTGDVVAMTGDGVNDAPALKQADIGVAMGKTGSDLARDAASLVITDDNFSTIVNAVSEGRQIYNKIKNAIGYLLSASMASLLVTTIGVFLHQGLLLLPLQLLWLNLIMHVFPCIGLVAQQNWDDFMSVPPRPRAEQLVDMPLGRKILVRSAMVSLVTILAVLVDEHFFGGHHQTSAALTEISGALLLLSWTWLRNAPAQGTIVERLRTFAPMLINTAIGYALLFGALYLPGVTSVLQTTPLGAAELLVILSMTVLCYIPFRISEKL